MQPAGAGEAHGAAVGGLDQEAGAVLGPWRWRHGADRGQGDARGGGGGAERLAGRGRDGGEDLVVVACRHEPRETLGLAGDGLGRGGGEGDGGGLEAAGEAGAL